jgi:hypothetical protein
MERKAHLMRISNAVIAVVLLTVSLSASWAQSPIPARPPAPVAAQPALAQPASASTSVPAPPVSPQLQPALNSVMRAVSSVRVDKWKRGNIRDEATQNISQIQRNIDVTLPPMLRDADSAPATLSTLLPISRNIGALYDVLLRVVEASRVVAPDDQVVQLQQALVTLGNARLAFSDRLQTSAVAMEKQVSDLRATVQTQAATIASTPVPVAVPCTPPPARTTPKKTTKRKPSAGTPSTTPAPATGTQQKPAASTPAKPSTQPAH